MNLLATSTFIIKALYGVATAGFFCFVFAFVKFLANLFHLVACKINSKRAIGIIKDKTEEIYDGKVVGYDYDVDVEFEGETIENQTMTINAKKMKSDKYLTGIHFDVYWNPKSETVVDSKQLIKNTIENALLSLVGIGAIVIVFVIFAHVK